MTSSSQTTHRANISSYDRNISIAEILVITILASVPLFISFPYHINIFLTWEGAYRIASGEVPFKDFGMPLGYGYWIIPVLFFKLFGATLFTLIKAQVFINIISGLAFRSIMRSFSVQPGLRFVTLVLYCISFSFYNFLPWYNHTNIVYEFIGLAFLLKNLFDEQGKRRLIFLILSAIFIFLSFFTKQDGGGMAILIALVLLVIDAFFEKKWNSLLGFVISLVVVGCLFILPLVPYGFGYWFNHGQAPHSSRISIPDILDTLIGGSDWLKFYTMVIVFVVLGKSKDKFIYFRDRKATIFLAFTLMILGEAAIYQVTSYTPPFMNIFFHSFAFVYILSQASQFLDFQRSRVIIACSILVLIWWSDSYYKSFNKYLNRFIPAPTSGMALNPNINGKTDGIHENVINRHTYILVKPDSLSMADTAKWVVSNFPSFKKVYLPPLTVKGMENVAGLKVLQTKTKPAVLNMTELTPLERDLHFTLEKGPSIPLWYHLGVGMFQKQADMYCNWIKGNHYQLVLFEYIPDLNNFYPFRVRDTLQKYYVRIDKFPAPRRPSKGATIEIYEPHSGPDVR